MLAYFLFEHVVPVFLSNESRRRHCSNKGAEITQPYTPWGGVEPIEQFASGVNSVSTFWGGSMDYHPIQILGPRVGPPTSGQCRAEHSIIIYDCVCTCTRKRFWHATRRQHVQDHRWVSSFSHARAETAHAYCGGQDTKIYGDSMKAWAPLHRSGGEGGVQGGDEVIAFDFNYTAALAEGYNEYIELTYNTSVYIQALAVHRF